MLSPNYRDCDIVGDRWGSYLQQSGSPGVVGGSNPGCERQLLCGCGLRSPLLIGLDFLFLAVSGGFPNFHGAATHRGWSKNRNFFCIK